jgi:hypothetical protein
MTKKGDTIPKYTTCQTCGKKLVGRQRVNCSRKCKYKKGNTTSPSYIRQKNRGIKRKLKLIKLKGGCCEMCGYKNNLAVLTFHHRDPSQKLFSIESRNISNYNFPKVLTEAEKCDLLCHNCHHETHYPDFNLKELKKKFDIT